MKKPQFYSAVLVALLVLSSSGCGGPEGPPRVGVSGKVTYKGKPVPTGMVMARPAEGVSGVGGTAQITDGAYAFDAATGPEPNRKYLLIVNLRDFGAQKGSPKGGGGGGQPSPLAALNLPPGKVEWAFELETPAEGETTKDLNIE